MFEHCYADLRAITPLSIEHLESQQRIASMTDLGRASLQLKLFTFFSGKAIPADLACPSCGKAHSLDAMLPRIAEENTGAGAA